jgi:hypothetical protein
MSGLWVSAVKARRLCYRTICVESAVLLGARRQDRIATCGIDRWLSGS